MAFKDHFSRDPDAYRKYRPTYPAALFRYLASLSPSRERAWDCATGTGQAAVQLARLFYEVVATDASRSQIDRAMRARGIAYRVAPAERTGIEACSVDVITVAQALHWFDLALFFQEAERVLKPDGVLAVWAYNLVTVNPDVDAIVGHLYDVVLRGYWPQERIIVERGYAGIRLPFRPVQPPAFEMSAHWTVDQFVGYLGTWSAVAKYREHTGLDALAELARPLARAWGQERDRVRVRWPLTVKVGVKSGST